LKKGDKNVPTLKGNMNKLDEILEMEANWDGYGANPFPLKHIQICKKILNNLSIQPDIFPTGRDSIQFEYENDEHYLEFEIFLDRVEVYEEIGEKKSEETFSHFSDKWEIYLEKFKTRKG
jgi:hypothetical protein